MKKIISKTNLSLMIIALCAILFCGLFTFNAFISKKQSMVHAYDVGSSATLRGGSSVWYKSIDYDIENLIITNSFNIDTATGEPVDVSEAQDGSLYAYKVDNGNETYNCVIYADVEKIYAPVDSSVLFGKSSVFTDTKLDEVKSITFENECFDTSNVTNMKNMFNCCTSLSSLDLTNFNTSNVTDMSLMFSLCTNLISLDLSSFDTKAVTSMDSMFTGCFSLTSLDLTNFDTSLVTIMKSMFAGCRSLNKLNISSFDFSAILQDDLSNFFGMKDEGMIALLGITLAEGQTFDQYLEEMKASNINNYLFYNSIRSALISELHVPGNMNNYTLYLPVDSPMLYVDGNASQALSIVKDPYTNTDNYAITSAEQGKILKVLNETPSTGFIDEQLLPAITIGLISIIAVLAVANKKKKYNI